MVHRVLAKKIKIYSIIVFIELCMSLIYIFLLEFLTVVSTAIVIIRSALGLRTLQMKVLKLL